jgi:hypothetical protein
MIAANDMRTSEMFCSVSSEATRIIVYSESSRKYAEVERGGTYQSPESAREELALLPAAAEAKEVGAIMSCCVFCGGSGSGYGRKRVVEAKRFSVGIVAGEGDAGAIGMMSGL